MNDDNHSAFYILRTFALSVRAVYEEEVRKLEAEYAAL